MVRKKKKVAARGRAWPVALLVGFEISRAASLAATRVAASGRKWPLGQWPQVTASGRKWLLGRQIPARMAPTLEKLEKNAFLANGIFFKFSVKREVGVETKGKK